jgi:NAD(P)-dependent dehydrogenase (short-subunit alcohol dehydrogenase family)
VGGVGRDLTGRVAIVGLDQPEVARRLATEGATVVLVGDDADAAGAVLAEIEAEAGPGRAAFFRYATPAGPADPDRSVLGRAPAPEPPSSGPTGSELDALVAFVAEQWPAREPRGPAPPP